jgi:uncharacterized protein YutE (UPF0331/DUF86 family)
MADDVLVNKAASIERAVRRVREEHAGADRNLLENQTRQDAIVLNLQRAGETSIDAAMHLVRVRRLGIPQESRDAFDMLEQAGVLDASLCTRMKKRVGFRNVAIHAGPDAGQARGQHPGTRHGARRRVQNWVIHIQIATSGAQQLNR